MNKILRVKINVGPANKVSLFVQGISNAGIPFAMSSTLISVNEVEQKIKDLQEKLELNSFPFDNPDASLALGTW